ncbi:MAG: hypothetical protein KF764_14220 [Labilithrix sp.]|nr:hypothetical protein [Labilithrix sp.]MBX3221343.1 hypothetical protein [Labilithrix sp.]
MRWRLRSLVLSSLALASASAVGCVGDEPAPVAAAPDGGGADTGDDRLAPFLGTWSTSKATQTLSNCQAAGTQRDITITLNVTRGTTSDILATNTLAPSCVLQANVRGDTATLIADQTCTATFPNAVDTYTYAGTSTFKLVSADGAQAVMQLDATISNSPSGATCTFQEIAPYAKK